jgi:hypothetical protein
LGEQKAEMTALKYEVLKSKAQNLCPKSDITVYFEENLTVRDLQIFADFLHKIHGGIRGVFSQTENGYAFCICGDGLDDLFTEFKSTFNVKGGGRNGMVQGTVVAQKENIEKFFNL